MQPAGQAIARPSCRSGPNQNEPGLGRAVTSISRLSYSGTSPQRTSPAVIRLSSCETGVRMDALAEQLRALVARRGISGSELACQVPCDSALISRYLNGRQPPSRRIDDVLGDDGKLAALAGSATPAHQREEAAADDELAAIELAQRCGQRCGRCHVEQAGAVRR